MLENGTLAEPAGLSGGQEINLFNGIFIPAGKKENFPNPRNLPGTKKENFPAVFFLREQKKNSCRVRRILGDAGHNSFREHFSSAEQKRKLSDLSGTSGSPARTLSGFLKIKSRKKIITNKETGFFGFLFLCFGNKRALTSAKPNIIFA